MDMLDNKPNMQNNRRSQSSRSVNKSSGSRTASTNVARRTASSSTSRSTTRSTATRKTASSRTTNNRRSNSSGIDSIITVQRSPETIRKASVSDNRAQKSTKVQNNIPKQNSVKYKKGGNGIGKKVLNACLYLFITGFVLGFFLLYGPFSKFRDWYITTAMTTMTHQYLATWFFDKETIDDVLSRNKIVETNEITDPRLVTSTASSTGSSYSNEYDKQILERDPNHPEYKIIEIKEKKFSGYLAAVYDPSQIHALVTKKLNKSGQYVTKMAEDNKAFLAINGGFFIDLKEDRTGGTPQGITIVDGEVISNKEYTGEGGLIGFNKNNTLILGKMDINKAKEMNIRDAMTAGPFLIINGKSSKVSGNGGWGTAPRTAIAQRKDGVVLFLVIDGRRIGKPGAQMNDLIDVLERYGAYNAAALDGGTSSVMVENYKIINDPIDSDGKHKTRPVATAFGVIKKEDYESNK